MHPYSHSVAGTGPKRRRIKVNDISINSSFEFNKSINPHGGTQGSMFVSAAKNSKDAVAKIYQDLNNDGIISRKELIYKGKAYAPKKIDELLNFNGDIILSKTMHKCEWLTAKHPDKELICTEEFIPTIYDAKFTSNSGTKFEVFGVGKFAAELQMSLPEG